jgi:gliding motility-associated-like protein
VFPKQRLGILAPDTICAGTPFDAEALYDSLYNRFRWNFGEGADDTARSSRASHVYADTGSYRIRLSGTYPVNTFRPFCPDSAERSIRVVQISADFIIDPASDTPEFRFINRSTGSIRSYVWDYGQPSSGRANSSMDRDGFHDYGIDTGWFRVCLTIRNAYGCEDSVCRWLYNDFYRHIFVPNVFTPNNDPYNEGFYIDIVGEQAYDLHIYNRWGQPVFHSDTDKLRWNGRLFNTGADCPEGTYYFVFHYRWARRDTDRKQVNGVVQLIR